ncbi:hypothetical protein [Streptomyces flavofungini]|uniref:hypothetical protein n=1 Tax=Streptomyces flavofungini TaxID=68200 RepID=UPI0034DED2A5
MNQRNPDQQNPDQRRAGQPGRTHPTAVDATGPVVCSGCGTTAEATPLTWTYSVENGVRRYFCDVCARANLRAIEGRLDSDRW